MAKKTASVTETYKIPSLGRVYGEGAVHEEVVIRSMTTQEEKMRLGNQGFYKTMCSILDAVVTSHEYEAKYLTVFDFFFLMYKMRIVSYGPIYKVSVQCPHCGKQVTIPVNLDNLEVKYIPEDFTEPFEIGPLPRSKDILKCRFMRVIDAINNEKKVKDTLAKNPNYIGDPEYIYEMACKIVSINGEEKTPIEHEMYVEGMQAMDSNYFQQAYSNIVNKVGMSTKCEEACPSCGDTIQFNLPFNSEFFRPTFDF